MSLEKSLPIKPEYFKYNIRELGQLLEESYTKLLEGRSLKRPRESFAPSQLFYGAGTCPRQWYYKFKGGYDVAPEFDAKGVFNMESGTASHHRLQDLFDKAGLQKVREQEIVLEYPPVKGFMDSMFKWQGMEIPVEVKTARQEAFFHKQATMEGAWYQILQLLLYMYILEKEVGFLFYENRNTGEWLILPIEMNEENREIIQGVIDWMKEVWDNEELPERPFTRKSKACKDCPFSEICWDQDGPGLVTIPPLKVPESEVEDGSD